MKSDGTPSGAHDGTPVNPQYKMLEVLKLPKGGDASVASKESPTIQGSFIDNNEETKCLLCNSVNQEKVHTLDCTHALCMNCAKEQLEAQLRTKQGNIIYYCKTCNAPKNLSTKLRFIFRDCVFVLRMYG